MSIETEPAPEQPIPSTAPTDETKPPLFRRPLVWIIAGAAVLVLVVGGIIAVTAFGGHPAPVRIADASADHSLAPTPHPSATPQPTTTPTASATATPPPASGAQPQSDAANPPAAQPAAPAAPAAPAPAPPSNAGPGRSAPSSAPAITEYKVIGEGSCHTSGPTPGTYYPIVLEWTSSNGTSASLTITTESTTQNFTTTTVSVSTQGPESFDEACNLTEITFKLTIAHAAGVSTTTATQSLSVETPY